MEKIFSRLTHKIRNIIFSMNICLEGLEKDREKLSQDPDFVLLLKKETTRLAHLIENVEHYTKPLATSLAKGSLEHILSRVLDPTRNSFSEKNIILEKDIPQNLPMIPMQADRLNETFQNLLENALFYSPPEGKIGLDIKEIEEENQKWLRCRIRNEGEGFLPSDLEKIFEPFFSRRQGHMGLGLAVVKRIVQEHRGKVLAQNLPEGGVEMILYLPL